MMSYFKLVEMNNNGVTVMIDNSYTSRQRNGQGKQWNVTARKEADGVSLSINHVCDDLDEGIDDIYQKWAKATGHGMPEHKLNILEHKPETPPLHSHMRESERRAAIADDEIPF
jgi:hypothetical protein